MKKTPVSLRFEPRPLCPGLPGRFTPDWVADLTGIRTGVMSRGLRLFEERLAEEKELRRRVDGLRRVMCEGGKGRIAKRQDTE